MFDAKSLLDQLLGTNLPGGSTVGENVDKAKTYARENPLATGAAAGGLAALLLGTKTGRSVAGNAATLGGLALLGGLAYKAYQNWQGGAGGAAPADGEAETGAPDTGGPGGDGFTPQSPEEANALGVALVTAMIAAAKADGHIDADEQIRIFNKMDELDLDSEAKAFLMDELRAPLDIDRIAGLARDDHSAMQIYAVSRLAVDPDHPAEKAYLETLADKLRLTGGFVREVDEAVRTAAVH
ncbi:MAG: DUF533 domain-containing protein [Hyphomicrobiales bacterium]|nr:MAG: DUF533 domain-containing protein [Hyphomicrobiales bacterium]